MESSPRDICWHFLQKLGCCLWVLATPSWPRRITSLAVFLQVPNGFHKALFNLSNKSVPSPLKYDPHFLGCTPETPVFPRQMCIPLITRTEESFRQFPPGSWQTWQTWPGEELTQRGTRGDAPVKEKGKAGVCDPASDGKPSSTDGVQLGW